MLVKFSGRLAGVFVVGMVLLVSVTTWVQLRRRRLRSFKAWTERIHIRDDGLIFENDGRWSLLRWDGILGLRGLSNSVWVQVSPVFWNPLPRVVMGTDQAAILAFLGSHVRAGTPVEGLTVVEQRGIDRANPFSS